MNKKRLREKLPNQTSIKTTYYERNKDRIKKYHQTPEYKEKQRKKSLEWHHQNLERAKIKHAKWYQKNKEREKLKQKEYGKEYRSRSEIKERNKKYAKEHYNPEGQLKANIKHIKKYAAPLKLPDKKFKYGLVAWSNTIKKRDTKLCQICGSTKKTHAHHIFEKSKYPQLSLNPNNGVTLCVLHHQQTHGRKLLS